MSTGQQTDQNTHQSHNQNKEKLDQIDSLIASFPDGQVPESSLGNALNNMTTQWNSLLTQVITEVDHTQQPIPLDHIKETAEFTVKEFKEACLEMNSELTRLSMHWQLKNPKEMLEQKTTDYENSIERQKKLLERIKQKIDNEANPMALGTQDLLRNFH